jgi:uncharacterized DUF497 family protein
VSFRITGLYALYPFYGRSVIPLHSIPAAHKNYCYVIINLNWDENKNQENIRKHKISFQEVETVFYDPNGKIIHDPDRTDEEDRFIILGLSKLLNVLVVCHCYREDDEIIRIITARKVTKNEGKGYGGK